MPHKSKADPKELWKQNPAEGFRTFILSEEFLLSGRRTPAHNPRTEKPYPIRETAANVYLAMFGKFSRWMTKDTNKLTIFAVKPVHILSFLDETSSDKVGGPKDLNSSIRMRYVQLLERVFRHLKVDPNPASEVALKVFRTPNAGKDIPLNYLSSEQIVAFMACLPAVKDPMLQWKRMRDRAMLAIMLGAGLKVSEVIGLYTENLGRKNSDGEIPIDVSPASTNGTSVAHTTILRIFAVEEVEQWLAVRKKLNFGGRLLFPANSNSDRGDGNTVDKATLYRQTKATYARAKIDIQRQGGRTLRNTFAVTELESKTSGEDLKEYLGHVEGKSMEIYVAGMNRLPTGTDRKV